MFKRLKEPHIQKVEAGKTTTFKIAWGRRKGLIGLGAFWLFFPLLLFIFFAALREGGADSFGMVLTMLALELVFWYFGRLHWRNYTVVQVSPAWLTVKHGPMPFYGNRRFAMDTVTGLVVKARKEKADPTNSSSSSYVTYNDVFVARAGKKPKILSSMSHFHGKALAEAFKAQLEEAMANAKP